MTRRLALGLLLAFVIGRAGTTASADDKYAQVGIGASFGQRDSVAYAFDFTFNRTESQDAELGPFLHVWKISNKAVLGLKPSAAASVGSGTESAANNLVLDTQAQFQRRMNATNIATIALAPTGTADKNFNTGLLYGRLKGSWIHYNSGPTRYYVVFSASLDFHGPEFA
jgi:hypothetical protein